MRAYSGWLSGANRVLLFLRRECVTSYLGSRLLCSSGLGVMALVLVTRPAG
jgi:hypothetical protein